MIPRYLQKKKTRNKNKLETLIQTIRIYSKDIGMEFGIKMFHADKKKWEKRNNWRNKTAKPEKKKRQNVWREVKIQAFKNIGIRHHPIEMKEKVFKKYN